MPQDGVERIIKALECYGTRHGMFRFPLAVIDENGKIIHKNPSLQEYPVSGYQFLLDKLKEEFIRLFVNMFLLVIYMNGYSGLSGVSVAGGGNVSAGSNIGRSGSLPGEQGPACLPGARAVVDWLIRAGRALTDQLNGWLPRQARGRHPAGRQRPHARAALPAATRGEVIELAENGVDFDVWRPGSPAPSGPGMRACASSSWGGSSTGRVSTCCCRLSCGARTRGHAAQPVDYRRGSRMPPAQGIGGAARNALGPARGARLRLLSRLPAAGRSAPGNCGR